MAVGGMPSIPDHAAEWTTETTAEIINSYLGIEAKALSDEALERYSSRAIRHGWQINVAFPDATRRLNILLTAVAPFRPPLIALADPPPKLTWPHVEDDGVLCLTAESDAVDWTQPVAVLAKLLEEASVLIEQCADSKYRDAEFRREFLSYWRRTTRTDILGVSLLRLAPPSRLIRAWLGKDVSIFAEDDKTLFNWMTNRYHTQESRRNTSASALLWLPEPMIPTEFPNNGAQLKELLKKIDPPGVQLVQNLLTEDFRTLQLVLVSVTANGFCLAGVELRRPPSISLHGKNSDQITRGFRPGRVPAAVTSFRALSTASAMSRFTIERADVDWIHNRACDKRTVRLCAKTVVLIGCGSLGGSIALQLAQSGVTRFVLCDPDVLTWTNTGRHVLGANHVGTNKAVALGTELTSRFNHATVNPFAGRWQEVPNWTSLIQNADLIVSATGDWASDAALNAHMHLSEHAKPIVYGWTEAYASAGQAIAILPGLGCLQCGFQTNGEPKIQLTDWPNKTTRQEPGCGTTFQPYGPIELAHSAALTSELALDCLMGIVRHSIHRVWFGATERLNDLGGKWKTVALDRFGAPGAGEKVARMEWTADAACLVCAKR